VAIEGAVVEQCGYQPVGEQGKPECGRQAEQQHQPQAPIHQGAVAIVVLLGVRRRQAGQQYRAQRDAQQGGWGNSISRSAKDSQVTLPGASHVAILVI